MKPLSEFICDECGELIESPEKGWLEWRDDEDGKMNGFRIVHHVLASPRGPDPSGREDGGCYYPMRVRGGDMHLHHMVGPDGLVRLLSMIEKQRVAKPDEVLDIIRRLNVPSYEEARRYWSEAKRDGFFAGENEFWAYTQSALGLLIKEYGPDEDAEEQ